MSANGQLFDIERPIPDRPKANSDQIVRAAAESLAKELVEAKVVEEQGWESSIDDLFSVLKNHSCPDGFEIAKDLDSWHGWHITASVVELLDGASHHIWRARDAAWKKWVSVNSVRPTRAIGDPVSVKRRPFSDEMIDGFVASIDEEQATYLIRCPSEGHVESGIGTHGIVLEYERVFDPAG